jgi:predicted acylesterase/phospholipase RssA
MALCLSGGGYRAMVFHVGVLWRLYETGLLQTLRRISSVSGGSITAGVLALGWKKLTADPARPRGAFERELVTPIRALADETLDRGAILFGIALFAYYGWGFGNPYEESIDEPGPIARGIELVIAAGVVFGLTYWAVAGRKAGAWRDRM